MKITRLSVHRVSLAAWAAETRYTQGRARDIEIETNVLRVETDTGIVGWGETCTAPSYYHPTEDFFGTGITLAAVTHIAHTLPRWATFGLYDYHLPAVPVVRNPLPVVNGTVSVPDDAPAGLGVDIDDNVIGSPTFGAEI